MAAPRRPVELDDVDRVILRALRENARIPNNALAERAGIAPSTCLMRVRRLQDAGVVRGFHADLAPDALGLPIQALIFVRLQGDARSRLPAFTQRFAAMPGVRNVFFLAGSDDFAVHVAAPSTEGLRRFVEHMSVSGDIAETRTNLIFEHVAAGSYVD